MSIKDNNKEVIGTGRDATVKSDGVRVPKRYDKYGKLDRTGDLSLDKRYKGNPKLKDIDTANALIGRSREGLDSYVKQVGQGLDDLTRVFGGSRSTGTKQSLNRIREFKDKQISGVVASQNKLTKFDRLARSASRVAMPVGMATSEKQKYFVDMFKETVHRVAIDSEFILGHEASLVKPQTTDQLFAQFGRILKGTDSPYASQVASAFMRNVDAVQAHLDVTGSLPQFKAVPATGVAKEVIKGIGTPSVAIEATLEKMKTELGAAELKLETIRTPGALGEELSVAFKGGQLGEVSVDFMISRNLVSGSTGIGAGVKNLQVGVSPDQTILVRNGRVPYQAPAVSVFDVESGLVKGFKHDEFVTQRLHETAISEIANMERRTQSKVQAVMRKAFEGIDTAQTIPMSSLEGAPMLGHTRRYLRARSHLVRLVPGTIEDKGFSTFGRPLTPEEITSGFEKGLIRAGGNPERSIKGIFLAGDAPPIEDIWMYGRGADPARRIDQVLMHTARGIGPDSRKRLRQGKGTVKRSLAAAQFSSTAQYYGMSEANIPVARTQFVSTSGRYAQDLVDLGIGEGAAWRSPEFSRVLGTQEDLYSLDIVSTETAVEPGAVIKKGQAIGISPSGSTVSAQQDVRILSSFAHEEGVLRIGLRGEGEQRAPQSLKLFGDKVMTSEVDMTASHAARLGGMQNVDLLTSSSLKKDTFKHRQQMVSALMDMVHEQNGFYAEKKVFRRQYQDKLSTLAREIKDNPGNFTNKLHKFHNKNVAAGMSDRQAHGEFIKKVWRQSRRVGLSSEGMGLMFGGLVDFAGSGEENIARYLKEEVGLSARELTTATKHGFLSSISRTSPIGLIPVNIGDVPSGGRGSIEPRIFQTLASPLLGEAGEVAAAEYAYRVLQESPEIAVSKNQAALATASTMSQDTKFPEGAQRISIADIQNKHFQPYDPEFLGRSRSGVVIETGLEGIGNIYMPTPYSAPAFAPMALEDAKATGPGEVMRSYQRFVEGTQTAIREGDITGISKEVDTLRQELVGHQAGLISGKGSGAFRRKVPASMYLKAVGAGLDPEAKFHVPDEMTVGISSAKAERLVGEMGELGLGFDRDLRDEFLRGDADIGGIMHRNPYIYQTSATPVKVRVLTNLAEDQIAVARRSRQMNIAGKMMDIDLGLTVLQNADFDGDILALSLVRTGQEQIQDFTEGYLQSSVFNTGKLNPLELEQVRMQTFMGALRGKADDISSLKLAEGSTQKVIAGKGSVGALSVGLSEMRSAILATEKMSSIEKVLALGLATHLEEAPISGKHIPADQWKTFAAGMEGVKQAVNLKGGEQGKAFAGVIRDLFAQSKDRDVVESLFSEEFMIDGTAHQGYDLDKISRLTTEAMYDASHSNRAKVESILAGREGKFLSADDAWKFLSQEVSTIMDLVGPEGISSGVPRGMRDSVADGLISINRAAASGERALSHAKPVLLGVGAMLGVAALLSSPGGSLEAPQVSANTRGRRDKFIPPEGLEGSSVGSPTPPPLMPNRGFVSKGGGSPAIRSRASLRTSQPVDMQSISSTMGQSTGANQVYLSQTDNRQKLLPHEVASFLR